MNNPAIHTCNIKNWVDSETDVHRRELRQAVHTVLHAITRSENLNSHMIMKGGILLAIRYQSSRFTKDIDFSTDQQFAGFDLKGFIDEFQANLAWAVEDLDYALDCRLQRHEVRPKGEDKTFQTLSLRIGYAPKDSRKHRSLLNNTCADVLEVDYSFNEVTQEKEFLKISDQESLSVYSFPDLIAEKFRAILQQETRNRYRRQDPYDLFFLLQNYPVTPPTRQKILKSLSVKCSSRNLRITRQSLANPKIKSRSEADYGQLADEIEGPLPPFAEAYGFIQNFYEDLPWGVT